MRPVGKPDQLQKRRHQAIELLKRGERPVDLAHKLGVNRRTVRFWNAAYRKNGLQGLKAKPNLGRPAKLSGARKKQLERCLLQGPEAHGFSTPLWTCPRVREVVKCQFGVVYHVGHIWHLLRLPEFPSWIAGFDGKSGPFAVTKKFVRSPCYGLHFFVRQKARLFRLCPRAQLGNPI